MKRITAIVTALAVVCGSAYLKAGQARTIVSAQQAAEARARQNQVTPFHKEILNQAAIIEKHLKQDPSTMSAVELRSWYDNGKQKIQQLEVIGLQGDKGTSLVDEINKYMTQLNDMYQKASNTSKTANGKQKRNRRAGAIDVVPSSSMQPAEQVYPLSPFESSKR